MGQSPVVVRNGLNVGVEVFNSWPEMSKGMEGVKTEV